jgi:Grx4 family monothiol glutaredoxin
MVCVFTAVWAPQSKQVVEAVKELSKDQTIGSIKYFHLVADQFVSIAEEYGVDSVPSTVLITKQQKVAVIEGTDITSLTKKIKEVAFKSFPTSVTEIPSSEKDKTSLNDRLKALINSKKVMLFIKGTRDAPRCGFTRQLIEIMNGTSVPYETFDILSDEEVRQGLKTYSNWPTYPQIYVNGNLVGGLDIIKELKEMDELMDTLNADA